MRRVALRDEHPKVRSRLGLSRGCTEWNLCSCASFALLPFVGCDLLLARTGTRVPRLNLAPETRVPTTNDLACGCLFSSNCFRRSQGYAPGFAPRLPPNFFDECIRWLAKRWGSPVHTPPPRRPTDIHPPPHTHLRRGTRAPAPAPRVFSPAPPRTRAEPHPRRRRRQRTRTHRTHPAGRTHTVLVGLI